MLLAILSVGTLVFSQCDKSSNVACKRRVRKSHGENLVSPGKLDARGGLELSSTWNNTTRNRDHIPRLLSKSDHGKLNHFEPSCPQLLLGLRGTVLTSPREATFSLLKQLAQHQTSCHLVSELTTGLGWA